ncbi:hypothetical protein EJF18_50497 [Clavispora lusitaniae]|uniref:Uncharacterized protein n=2 Tax=Clavispora lusitaniae TaxID=36911 RepID=A0AA91T2R1_CLALS|nr:hypothetical protein A9F13_04g01804 [Clavispora lusitaniae]QFZ29266.1 hypothetical protein EJF14_50497 [Clavispora lusitaniae]QFZ34929.1 hypothetical protein EJF16_50497 [Clavispora lusitaniae]QFZ40614.1 hypothetical protein EJF15_50497 [Clavispora lusitaniae]QFZ46294.1 hypothetical protein EJF18_50497 [Clavispora lusitaniae]
MSMSKEKERMGKCDISRMSRAIYGVARIRTNSRSITARKSQGNQRKASPKAKPTRPARNIG